MSTAVLESVPFLKIAALDEINARPSTKDGIEELAASIAVKGLIQPLAVRRHGDAGDVEVIDGRRRLQAIGRLVKDKAKGWDKTTPVPVIVRQEKDDMTALETSLMANVVRLPMHPVDQFAVFAKLAEHGVSDKAIAGRFGITEKTVRQHRALGSLAPAVRDAWRKGNLDAEAAKAFCIHPDHTVQEDALKRLGKRDGIAAWNVRHELAGKRESVDGFSKEVLKLYTTAGGKITQDLFSDEAFVDDPALAQKCHTEWAEKAAKPIKDKLLKAGFAWVDIDDENSDYVERLTLDDDTDGPMRTLAQDAEKVAEHLKKFTPEERAKSGAVIEIDGDGEIRVSMGLLKSADVPPRPERKTATAEPSTAPAEFEKSARAESGPWDVSQALQQTVSETLTIAVADALATDTMLAMRLITAALTSSWMSPANVRNEGHITVRKFTDKEFGKVFAALLKTPDSELAGKFCAAIGTTLDLTHDTWRYKSASRSKECDTLRDALQAGPYLAAARAHFVPEDYFKRANKNTATAAIGEMRKAGCADGAAPDKDLEALKKGELAGVAATFAAACGWLPPELRHPEYKIGHKPSKTEKPAPAKKITKAKKK